MSRNTNYFVGEKHHQILNDIFTKSDGMSHEDQEAIKCEVNKIKHEISELRREAMQLNTLLHCNKLRKQGESPDTIKKYLSEDNLLLKKLSLFKNRQDNLRTHLFGYPRNLTKETPLVDFLRDEEARLPYSNNCGDPFEEGNYQMHSKVFEREILKLFFIKFGVSPDKGWGYITSGGTESNTWGIRAGFMKFPNGMLYFSEAAHYSVDKAVLCGGKTIFPFTVIPQEGKYSEKIDKKKLLSAIKHNWNTKKQPTILILTWGTTKFGEFDDIADITKELKDMNIDYYLHIDAACLGGVPNNQTGGPILQSLEEIGAHSISVSFHKYFDTASTNSVVISTSKVSGKQISYIGQMDTTIAGSRSFPTFSCLQKIKEVLERSPEDLYIKNINYFEKKLIESKVDYYRATASNTFVFPKPSDDVCSHYQLSTFEATDGDLLAHAIIFPYHRKKDMDRLVNDLANCQKSLHKPSASNFPSRSPHHKRNHLKV